MTIRGARLGRRGDHRVRRREFVTLLAGSATALALSRTGHAQPGRMRRVGILLGWDENNASSKFLFSRLTQRLRELGWREESNIRLDVRWAAGNVDRMRVQAKELVELGPDLIVTCTTPATAALLRETRTLPVVFVIVSDPIGAGFVASLSRPGANITGFINLEPTMGGKWLELLKEIAPRVMRVAIMFNPDTAPSGGSYFLPSFEAAARSVGVEAMKSPVRSEGDIERTIAMLGQEPSGGLVVQSDGFMLAHRANVISLSVQHHVPAVSDRTLPTEQGGLLSYGPVDEDLFAGAAVYVDRILHGTKPAELPVQVPTKFELRLNLKTARALGLTIPPSILGRADEVIE
ncbi:ABC transporter substrate-binding protein [Bradyrhizobium sp. CCGUVB14]|uniref:ABC transporter substrate-binding protein n=1 Tax=Bradyrhizobium sp. CCGUVB14 TaxID=2949628 RepID=UPI0020B25E34|nr:ABC transporter substrate-binding protein [Bradyrhizobium sp. CCGUVB14]MCP3443303.1 ABC transporter substrate-binding protein [Bradyrhizobium sp. CCGUVB14]